jgi:polysaccharide export outer membrane protein
VLGYRLGPGDQVQVTVFRHEDLSGPFALDGEGYLALPLVGEILAGGLNARQLENEIEIRLKGGGYLVNPQVGIQVLNYRPFYIIGEVRNPGSFQYVSGMTVINAVALAGGFTYRADQDDIVISRGGSDGPKEQARPDSQVLPGDIVEVTERFF